jgi:hypothetical protein
LNAVAAASYLAGRPVKFFSPWTLDGIGREKLETDIYQLWVFWLALTKFSRFLPRNLSKPGKT